MRFLRQIVIILVVLLALDAVWLTMNMTVNRTLFASIQGTPLTIRWIPAALVYALIAAAVWYFAVRNANSDATVNGAAIGFAMYGLYDLTNYATLTKYPLSYAVMDIMWGTFLCSVAATAASF